MLRKQSLLREYPSPSIILSNSALAPGPCPRSSQHPRLTSAFILCKWSEPSWLPTPPHARILNSSESLLYCCPFRFLSLPLWWGLGRSWRGWGGGSPPDCFSHSPLSAAHPGLHSSILNASSGNIGFQKSEKTNQPVQARGRWAQTGVGGWWWEVGLGFCLRWKEKPQAFPSPFSCSGLPGQGEKRVGFCSIHLGR